MGAPGSSGRQAGAGRPVLLAVAPDGQRWEDPSEDLLYMFVEDLTGLGRGTLRVERLDSTDAGVLEISRTDDTFQVRRQDNEGVAVAEAANLREAHAAVTRWAFRLDGKTAARARAMWGGFDGTLAWRPAP